MVSQLRIPSLHLAGVFLTLYCAACTSQKGANPPPIEHTFRLAWENMPRTVDPRFAMDADSQYLGDFIHCSLIRFDAHGQIQNHLASDIRWINPQIFDVTLNPAFTFSSQSSPTHSPVTAEDVKATFDFFSGSSQNSGEPSPLKSQYSTLKSVELISPTQLRFHLVEPDVNFLEYLSIGILPKSLALGPRIVDPNQVIGCGHFEIEKWAIHHIQLKRKTPIQPIRKTVQWIRIEIVKDENTRLLKLRNSELDLVQNSINRDQLNSIHKFKHLKVIRTPGNNTSYLGFQMSDPILKSLKVRQAIAFAIDRRKIVESLLHGWAELATTLLTPDDPFLNRSIPSIPYQPEKAKKLLAEAGFSEKLKLTLKLHTTTNPASVLIAQTIANDLQKVGIHLQLEIQDWGKFKATVDQGQAQMWYLNWIGFHSPDLYRTVFSSHSFPPNGANRGRFSHSQFDLLVDQARKTLDITPRRILYHQAQKIIADEIPYVFLWHTDPYAVIHTRVQNYHLHSDGSLSAIEDVTFTQ